MEDILVFLVFIVFLFLVIGLIKPSLVLRWGYKKTRGRVLLIFGGALYIIFVIYGLTTSYMEGHDITEDIFTFFFSLLLLIFVIGMINPSLVIRWGNKRTRSRVILICSISLLTLGLLHELFVPQKITPESPQNIVSKQKPNSNQVPNTDNLLSETHAEKENTNKIELSNKYDKYKTLSDFEKSDKELKNLFKQFKIPVNIEDSPLYDGTPRRIYTSDAFLIEVIGKPKVKQADILFFPTNDNIKNLNILGAVISLFKVFGKPKGNDMDIFLKNFEKVLKSRNNLTFSTTYCIVEMEFYKELGSILVMLRAK